MFPKILIVDDEMMVCNLLLDLLKGEKYHVETVSNAKKALAKIKLKTYDLIISDIKMPGMNGFELLEKIKKMNVNSAVIFITGYGSIDSAVDAMKLGVSDYIEKPFDTEQLKLAVSNALKDRQQQNYINKDKLLAYTLSRASFQMVAI